MSFVLSSFFSTTAEAFKDEGLKEEPPLLRKVSRFSTVGSPVEPLSLPMRFPDSSIDGMSFDAIPDPHTPWNPTSDPRSEDLVIFTKVVPPTQPTYSAPETQLDMPDSLSRVIKDAQKSRALYLQDLEEERQEEERQDEPEVE